MSAGDVSADRIAVDTALMVLATAELEATGFVAFPAQVYYVAGAPAEGGCGHE